jgi:hypothetical protein
VVLRGLNRSELVEGVFWDFGVLYVPLEKLVLEVPDPRIRHAVANDEKHSTRLQYPIHVLQQRARFCETFLPAQDTIQNDLIQHTIKAIIRVLKITHIHNLKFYIFVLFVSLEHLGNYNGAEVDTGLVLVAVFVQVFG